MSRYPTLVPALSACILSLASTCLAQIDPELLAGMKARRIGPAGMSGRVAQIAAVESDPKVVYVGAATGGLWKSENAGLSFEPIFDDQPVAAIGAIAIYQKRPEILWVGTGEGNVRNSVSVGNGIYKSMDGGRSFTHLGLENTERIHRILLHPDNPDIAYVAALGKSWGENEQRGVFKTSDGGETWQKILYVDERTGCADLIIDPSNPDKLFAAMWEHRRWPWSFKSGGPGSGLYMTLDGGTEWRRFEEADGMPKGELGRIGLGIAKSNPMVVYALIEAKTSAVLRSDDGGFTWATMSEDQDNVTRPFYYADIRVDPELENRVYNLQSSVSVSEDGGKTFEPLIPFSVAHPDHHAMWINPADPQHIIEGNDGGVYISRDRGKSWGFVTTLPLAQFYHIAVDMETPYNVYGGMQDNGSWRGPSEVWENGGIRNHHWAEVGFGDGFDTQPDPDDALAGYSMSQEGFLKRYDLRTGERRDVRPSAPDGVTLRFNWNAGLALDPFSSSSLYYGSQFVHKSTDRGETWTIISPDLTSNNSEWQQQAASGGITLDVTGAENYTTIMTIAPSPLQAEVIWAGTDDGRVHVTRDGGQHWTSVEGNIPGLAAGAWCPHIEANKFDPASAFAIFDDHRRSNWTPYVYRSDDYGQTWQPLATSDLHGYALVLEQDPVDPNLLFLGTEFGLYFSQNGGAKWSRFDHGVPTVSCMDLVVHPREHDLVIGTHGRAAFIIDDISPLRSLDTTVAAKQMHLFTAPAAQQYRVKQTGASRFPGGGEFRGDNPAYGIDFYLWMGSTDLPHPDAKIEREEQARQTAGIAEASIETKEDEDSDDAPKVKITVHDATGAEVCSYEREVKRGLNRLNWSLASKSLARPKDAEEGRRSGPGPNGPEVLPGVYQLKVSYEGQEVTGSIKVLPDPRTPIATEDRVAKAEALAKGRELNDTVVAAIDRLRAAVTDIDYALGKKEAVEDETRRSDLVKAAKALKDELQTLEKKLWTPPGGKGITARTHVLAKVGYATGSLSSTWDAPTETQLVYLRQAASLVTTSIAEVDAMMTGSVAAFRDRLSSLGIGLLTQTSK